MSKKHLGQFFTTNVDQILSGFEKLIAGKHITDPFAGGGDLLSWAKKNGAASITGFDIDPKLVEAGKVDWNDSLLMVPRSEFILTNPPYLGKNKMTAEQKQKYMLDSYEDFYLLALKRILNSESGEGIAIVPVNFLSAENSDKLRSEFLSAYKIGRVKYFRFQVFDDTTYNVIAFHFKKKEKPSDEKQILKVSLYSCFDSKSEVNSLEVEPEFSYRIAGRELNEIMNVEELPILRLTEEVLVKNKGRCRVVSFFNDKKTDKQFYVSKQYFRKMHRNIILLNCIDTNSSEEAWINAEDIKPLKKAGLVGKHSSRNIAFVILPDIEIWKQREMIYLFNKKLNRLRKKYSSLFLTNFRDNDRKRISFEFCYKLLSYCYNQI